MWEKQKRHTLVKMKINNKTLITSSNQGFIFNYKFAPFSITATLFD
jgi:hypothetical protein